MKPNKETLMQSNWAAFTLIELLVVIMIIGILVGILIPVVGRAKTKAKVATAKVEMAGLKMAIESYKNDYNRWPAPKNYPRNIWGDVSIGWEKSNLKLSNNDLMAILMAKDAGWGSPPPSPPSPLTAGWWQNWFWNRLPATDDKPAGANPNHGRNPKKNKYIDPKESGEIDGYAGLSEFGNYHDPFGNDYKISMDVNGDGFCHEWFYGAPALAGLSVGLDFQNSSNGQAGFALKGELMIWSYGPDREGSVSKPALNEINEDNILSWR